jgi:hypothetical protein
MATELQDIIDGVNNIMEAYQGHAAYVVIVLAINRKFPQLSINRIAYHFGKKSKQEKESSPCFFCMAHESVDADLAKIIRQKPFYLSKQISDLSKVPEEIVLDHMAFHMK